MPVSIPSSQATISVSQIVNMPPSIVFAAATDWPRQREWIPGTRVTLVDLDGKSVGSTIAAYTGFFSIGFTDLMEITNWEPPYLCQVKHIGRFIRSSTGTFSVEQVSEMSTRFNWSETIALPFGIFGRIGWVLAKPVACRALSFSLKRFAKWAENEYSRK
jgi:hypothetical protein